jgi:hypothetical protein
LPSLTDTAIRQALKRVELSGKQEDLIDGEKRRTGRWCSSQAETQARHRRLDGAALARPQAHEEEDRLLLIEAACTGARFSSPTSLT